MISKITKHQLRWHNTLPNKQHIAMYIGIHRYWFGIVAHVGLAIAKNKRYCNDWYNCKNNKRAKSLRLKATGKCGLTGLIWAKNILSEVETYLYNKYNCPLFIQVGWADEQRKRAYAWLERDGYSMGEFDGESSYFKELREVPGWDSRLGTYKNLGD